MDFRIADTFTDSQAKLNGEEQKAIKTTAFDLQLNPQTPGFSFHKLDRAKDKNFWPVRVNTDIRIIVHKTQSSLLLCYVDHHDYAFRIFRRPETILISEMDFQDDNHFKTIKNSNDNGHLIQSIP